MGMDVPVAFDVELCCADDCCRSSPGNRRAVTSVGGRASRERKPGRAHRSMDHVITKIFILGVLCGSVLMACSTPTATPTSVGTVEEQLARGAPLYVQNCA